MGSELKINTPRQRMRAEQIKAIVYELEEYWPLTVRQIHYQAFSQQVEWDVRDGKVNLYENTQNQYKALSRLLTAMRVECVIPWESIQDTTRRLSDKRGDEDVSAVIQKAAAWLNPVEYERCLIQGQETYVEVWSEKEALFGILQRVTDLYCLRLASCRGFSSTTMSYEYGQRARAAMKGGQQPFVLFLSDFDPSGMEMFRVIQKKVERDAGVHGVRYERVALTADQIREHGLPHNPEATKAGDSRAARFVREHGNYSVELDALHPRTLQQIVREAIEDRIDVDLMEEQREIESVERQRLDAFSQEFALLAEKHGVTIPVA